MAAGIYTLHPYMNARQPPADTGDPILFPYNGTVTFKWGVEQAGTNIPTKYAITANGKWGDFSSPVNHYPIVFIVDALPGVYTTYANEAAMQADIGNGAAQSSWTGDGLGRYAQVGAEYWFLFEWNQGTRVWAPVRTATAAGTDTIGGILCDIFTANVDVADIPKYGGQPMLADQIFSLCWSGNGRHNPGHDAVFKLSPEIYGLHEDIFDRTELNTRVAGEKAIYPDEFVTITQLEAGNGISILYRNLDGSLTGYSSGDPLNIVIQANGVLGIRENTVTGINLGTGEAISWNSGTAYTPINEISFADDAEWTLDNLLARTAGGTPALMSESESIPVSFDVVESPSGKARLMARAVHNGFWVTHDNGVTVTYFDTAPNGTIQQIRFEDTASVTFTIAEETLSQPPGLTGFRHGIRVQVHGYSAWVVLDDDDDFTAISNNEELKFAGVNGVRTDLTVGTPNIITIDRPLQLQEDGVDVGDAGTTEIDFVSGTATSTTHTEDALIEVVDDGGGRRIVRVKVQPATTGGIDYHGIKTMWVSKNEGNGTMDNVFGARATPAFGDVFSYYNVGFAGQDGFGDYEKILHHGTAITEGTVLGIVESPMPDHALPLPLDINDDGVYDINVSIFGRHSPNVEICGTNGNIGNHRIDVTFFLYVHRSGVNHVYQFHDLYQWAQYYEGDVVSTLNPYVEMQRKAGHYDSIPWSVQGSQQMVLQSGDKIFGVLFFRGVGNAWRLFSVNMVTTDVHKLKDGMPTTWLLPHDLSNDKPKEFTVLNWD